MQQVFLSADDFGRSPERNYAIDKSFKNGWIKSAGLIVTGRYLQDAVNYINKGGYVEHVHCHFNLSGNIKGEQSYDKPLSKTLSKDTLFCKDGLFRSFSGLPRKAIDIFRFLRVYIELCAQYKKFKEVTLGRGNLSHIDFHLWFNLTWPVSVALNLFLWTHRIKSVRYLGIHHEKTGRRLFRFIGWNPFVNSYRSTNIDGFLTNPNMFEKNHCFELYCHPDFVNGEIIDNSISLFGNDKRSMLDHVNLLQHFDLQLVSWHNR